jgi:hypothetical protein
MPLQVKDIPPATPFIYKGTKFIRVLYYSWDNKLFEDIDQEDRRMVVNLKTGLIYSIPEDAEVKKI